MRERNNEASKRCRLKRRMKAETVEQQAHNLNMSNKFLRQRISRLEKICVVLKDGVRRIQSTEDCRCLDTVARIKQANADSHEDVGANLSNSALIKSSIAHRTVNADLLAGAAAPHLGAVAASPAPVVVKEETPSPPALPQLPPPEQPTQLPQLPQLPTIPAVEVRPTNPPPPPVCITFPGRSELSVTPVSKVAVVTSAAASSSSSSTSQPKTALDVINDTIIQSLRSGGGAAGNIVTAPCVPLNLVKVVPTSSQHQALQPPTTTTTAAAKQIIFVTSPTVVGRQQQPIVKEEPTNANRVVIKCEPEIQVVKREVPHATEGIAVGAMEDTEDEDEEEGVDPTLPCIAATVAARPNTGCSGDLVDLNKLSSYLDLISRNVARDNGRAAMERAIIKSRLRVPFWQADEVIFQVHGLINFQKYIS